MNGDLVVIVGGCAAMMLLPILAVVGVFIYRRTQQGKYESILKTDVGLVTQSPNGDVAFENNFWRNLGIVILFGGTLLFFVIATISDLMRGSFQFVWITLVWAIITVPVLWIVSRSLLKPRLLFNGVTHALEIKGLNTRRSIPFANLQSLTFETWQVQAGRYRNQVIECAQLGLRTKDNVTIDLGQLSSLIGRDDLLANCNEICSMISRLTGLPLPTETHRN